ncbi:TetR/AcrR family transcriptional regulator [Duganella sp. sic0402]|uniref:TetR/AcrR family transcriptional regulator n=1 Tax=Duganella sp. sic0402 TaxID=2854786 RepID=UPI001C46170F|nr:TetR/AcrR family transcriptional regulator [Duganella sp. sic0402]MBV7534906.1 TetR/AcrR family transcriptional regulator [Duganella sp. sic0402]
MQRRTRTQMIEETRAKLLATARKAFAEHGYANTSMDEFTAAVGLTRGALYHHFGSKEKLLIAVIDQLEGELAQRLQQIADAAPTPWEAFRCRCRAYLELALLPENRRIILQDARAMFGDVPQENQNTGIAALEAALQELIDAGTVVEVHAGLMARMLYGAVTEAAFWIAEPDSDPPVRLAVSLEALDKLLSGLLPR